MNEQVKWGMLFALERDLEAYLKFAKERPDGWLDSPDADVWKNDADNLMAACEWLIANRLPHYLNMGYLNRDLERLKELL